MPGPTSRSRSLVALVALILVGTAAPARGDGRPVDFNREVRPILAGKCYACHGPDPGHRKGRAKPLRLDTFEGATTDLGDGSAAIVAGKPDESELIARVEATDAAEVMPPAKHGARLTTAEVSRLRDWIAQGGNYATHWAYAAPVRVEPPEVKNPGWARGPIDRFVLARIEAEGLTPSPEADRATLARRVALDLTGLPPSIEDLDAFLGDTHPDAYERLVDRLLARPSYGEHWGRAWLDLARYADSAGYADDPPRTIWAYRDAVIRSFNANTPFDRFTIEQLAGDLLPGATEATRVATGFHRNTPTNSEGGTDDEEFRNVAVVDRTNTTATTWLGTTFACAQCHDHKYDPITRRDYFRLFAFFNNTEDADRRDEAPVLAIDLPETIALRADRASELATREDIGASPLAVVEARGKWLAVGPTTTVPVLRERPEGKRRPTLLQVRGDFRIVEGDDLAPGVPDALGLPIAGANPRPSRLDLARWIASPANPLTARVVVNRYWEAIFGVGLVATGDDFGVQGDLPSHPELLDHLAIGFVADGWDLKGLLRRLVTSATYRQGSRIDPSRGSTDPDNRLLARGPRVRLPAEAVRDASLAVAGLLDPTLFGPPVRPFQPALGLSAAFGAKMDWEASRGADAHRRAIYTLWRRTSPYPSMSTLDAPSREVCTPRRSRTNTPLQALVTLNDPAFVEAAQGLARRMIAGSTEVGGRVRLGVRLALAREPSPAELDRLVALHREAIAAYATDAAGALKLATEPIGPLPAGVDPAEGAAWTVVANVLLNLDEFVFKR